MGMTTEQRLQLHRDWMQHMERELELLNRELTDPTHGVEDLLSIRAAIHCAEHKIEQGRRLLAA